MKAALHTHNGFKITETSSEDGSHTIAAVFDPRSPLAPALHETDTLERAMRWIDAYQDGRLWAPGFKS